MLVARSEWLSLLYGRGITFQSIDAREVADLFGPAPPAAATRALFAGHDLVHSWTGYQSPDFAHRIGQITGGQVFVHPFHGMRSDEHASHYFARCVGSEPEICTIAPGEESTLWAEQLWRRHDLGDRTLVVHPGSGSRAKNWQGMAALAQAWRRLPGAHVVGILGPAEDAAAAGLPFDAKVSGESLPHVAAVLRRAHKYVGNDSGISHLAGVVGADGVVLFGPTAPTVWRPQGHTLRVVAAPAVCPDCGIDRFCLHRLPLATVSRALGLEATTLGA